MATAPQKEDCDIFEDSEGRDTKHKIVRSMRFETFLNSISKVAGFAAGPVFGAGAVMAVGNFVGHAATFAAVGTGTLVQTSAATGVTAALAAHIGTGAALAAGLASVGWVAVGIVAVGAALMAASVAADFISTRIYQDKQLDMQEFNAKRAGHHIVHELQAQNMCLTTGKSEAPCEDKQKNWSATVATRGPQAESWSASIDAQRQQVEASASATASTGRA